jgi:TolB protein
MNGKLVFWSVREGANQEESPELYVMNADGSGQTQLTTKPGFENYPAWSPDGSKIAFARAAEGSNYDIYVMNSDGTGQTQLTSDPAQDDWPAWSPDGTRIAFSSQRDGNSEVYVMNADGSGQTDLTNNPAADDTPAWSPDGTQIAFATSRDGNSEVYVMGSDGVGQVNLSSHTAQDAAPAWSPDGSKIAFVSERVDIGEIFVMNSDGSGQTNLTNNPAQDTEPDWSPDGTKVAFATVRDGNWEIYAMNADGTAATNLTNDPADDDDPSWQPVDDGDGISTEVDADPATFSDDFSDLALGGGTLGRIVDRAGLSVFVRDEPLPVGVHLSATGSGGPALIESCFDPTATYSLTPGDELTVTCGSATTQVVWGPVTATFGSLIATLPTGSLVLVEEPMDGVLDVTSSPTSVSDVTFGGLTISPGNTVIGVVDSDGDGLADAVETDTGVFVSPGDTGTDPMDPDTDSDDLFDGPEVVIHGSNPFLIDTEGDGCADGEELGATAALGGGRNPTFFWDFFDVPTPPSYTRDRAVSVADISAVVARFGAARPGGPPDKSTALAEAQSAPPLPPAYHAGYDRTPNGSLTGPPDGAISVQDIGRAVAQFGHSCIGAP